MKYSFMSFNLEDKTLKELFALAKKYGYDGIEPRLQSGHKHGIEITMTEEEIQNALRLSKEYGVKIATLAVSNSFADPDTFEKNVAEMPDIITLANKLSVKTVRVFGGLIPNDKGEKEFLEKPSAESRKEAADRIVKGLNQIKEFAAEKGVFICVEVHDHWCDPKNLVPIIERVNHPNICVNWDIMHPVMSGGRDLTEAFNELKPYIKHVHFHDGIQENGGGNNVPMGQGTLEIEKAVQLLMRINYDGYLSGEWFDFGNPDVYLPHEISLMKKYEKN